MSKSKRHKYITKQIITYIGFEEVVVIKDIDFEHILIFSPSNNEQFGKPWRFNK